MNNIYRIINLLILLMSLTSCVGAKDNPTVEVRPTVTMLPSPSFTPKPSITPMDLPPTSLVNLSAFSDYFKIAYSKNTPTENETLLNNGAWSNPEIQKNENGSLEKVIRDPLGVKLFVKKQDDNGNWGEWQQSLETQKGPIDAISKFVNAMTNAGIKMSVIGVIKQGFTFRKITGKDGKKYEIASTPCGDLVVCQ